MSNKHNRSLILSIFVLVLAGGAAVRMAAQDQVDKTRTIRNTFPLIAETDLYCAFFVLEQEPGARILAQAAGDRLLLSDADQFWGGPVGEWREGLILQILEIGTNVPGVRGNLGYGRGRARIVRVEGNRFLAQIEKACGPVRLGNGLLPFEKKTTVEGRDLGYRGILQGGGVLTGHIIVLPDDHDQIGANGYALIDRGLEAGLQLGQQLTVFGAEVGDKSPQAVGNAVVIGAGRETATIKILSLKDVIRKGDLVQVK